MNFPSLKFETKFKKSSISSLKTDEKSVQRLCKNIQLSKIISVFIPEIITLESLKSTYYTIDDFKVADIFTKNFIDGYVLSGDLCCVSTYEDYENCQILLSEKKLVIRLDKELYYSLAAIHLTKFIKKSDNDKLYVTFEVDMTDGNACKIRNEFLSEEIDKLSIKFLWKPADSDICPSSLAKFLTDMGYDVKDNENNYLDNSMFSIKIPKLPLTKQLTDENYDEWSDITENISMLMLGCDTDEMSSNKQHEYIKIRSATTLHYKGFIPCSIILDLFKEIQNILTENSSIPYIAISSIPQSHLQRNFHAKLLFITSKNIYACE